MSETSYQTGERLLRALHDLYRRGRVPSPEADALCEEMADHWQALSHEQQDRLGRLSERLYRDADSVTSSAPATGDQSATP